jgi:shikimate kinase
MTAPLTQRPVAVVVGAPGAGKSTVGARVAEHFHLPFVDTDHLVEERAGMSVADIFVTEGESRFRDLEADAVAGALANEIGVVSLGGGAILRPETRTLLAGHRVIWLRVDASHAAKRVGMNSARPLLVGNVRGTMQRLMSERSELYEEVCTDVVDTSEKPLKVVVSEVCEILEQR